MTTIQDIWTNLDWSILYRIIPALLCITVHECSHGLMALHLGDDTAKRQGRLSLNPLRHIDLFGLIMMIFFRFGWAKPVPVDMRKFKDPKKGMALTALAGPLSNLVLAAVALLVYGLLFVPLYNTAAMPVVSEILQTTAYLSLNLAVFNLIPIPPLDGSKMLFAGISNQAYYKLMRYERFGMLLLLLLLATGVLTTPLSYVTGKLFSGFFHIASGTVQLVLKLI